MLPRVVGQPRSRTGSTAIARVLDTCACGTRASCSAALAAQAQAQAQARSGVRLYRVLYPIQDAACVRFPSNESVGAVPRHRTPSCDNVQAPAPPRTACAVPYNLIRRAVASPRCQRCRCVDIHNPARHLPQSCATVSHSTESNCTVRLLRASAWSPSIHMRSTRAHIPNVLHLDTVPQVESLEIVSAYYIPEPQLLHCHRFNCPTSMHHRPPV